LKFACKFIPWYLHEVDKLTSKKYARTINLLCKDNKVFVKYQAQGGSGANQKKTLRTPFVLRDFNISTDTFAQKFLLVFIFLPLCHWH